MDEQRLDEAASRQISLADLPVEIFLHICEFLDSSTLAHNLALACKRFHEILEDKSLWKVRANQLWRQTRYPIVPTDEDDQSFWKLSCLAIEKQTNLWKNKDNLERLSCENVHYGTVDAVVLINNAQTCISGGRDRMVISWNLPTTSEEQCNQTSIGIGHEGWVWDITAIGNVIYSCGWDRSIRSWDVKDTGLYPLKSHMMYVEGALLCIKSCPELKCFAAGSFCKNVLMVDTRIDEIVVKYQPHQRAIIKVSIDSQYIVSASEDKTVAVYDIRAGKLLKSIEIAKYAFPMSLCARDKLIYVGDSNGSMHIIDEKRNFNMVKSYRTGHKKGITGIHASRGIIVTASLDSTVRLFSPTDPLHTIACVKGRFGDICSMDYSNDVMAISGESAVELWRPKTVTNHSL